MNTYNTFTYLCTCSPSLDYMIIIIIMQVPDFILSSLILNWAEISTAKNTKISGLKYLRRKTQDQDLWSKDNKEKHASFVAVGIGSTPPPPPSPLFPVG